MSEGIEPVVMPKWGLAMTEGMLSAWLVEEGQQVKAGGEIAEIETAKIVNTFESPAAGVLRRRVVDEGDSVPVGALLAVIAEASVGDEAIDAFIAEFRQNFVPEESAAAAPEPQSVEAGGRRLQYLSVGPEDGAAVLLIHGFGADHKGWMFNQPALAERHRAVAFDLPGHGGSGKDVGDGSAATLADSAVALAQTLGLSRLHLVGHSLGGAIAIHAAQRLGEAVTRLTLIAPAGLGPEVNGDFLREFVAAGRRKGLRPVLEQLVADPGLITREMIDDVLKFKRLDGVETALNTLIAANFADGRQQLDLRPALAALEIPVGVIWGREDKILPAAHAEGLPEHIDVVLLDGVGHIPQMEAASAVNARLDA